MRLICPLPGDEGGGGAGAGGKGVALNVYLSRLLTQMNSASAHRVLVDLPRRWGEP